MENNTQQTTEKKPSKVSRIISIVLLAVIAVLALSTLVLSVTPKNFNIGLAEPSAIKINTSNQSIKNSRWEKDAVDGVYNKVMELYNKSFNTTLLNALFKGVMVTGVSIEEGYSYFSSIEGDYIEFLYNQPQTLKLGGKNYTPTNSGIYNTFVSVIIEVENTNSIAPITAYIRHGGENNTYTYSRVRFNTFAAQAELYEYINSL